MQVFLQVTKRQLLSRPLFLHARRQNVVGGRSARPARSVASHFGRDGRTYKRPVGGAPQCSRASRCRDRPTCTGSACSGRPGCQAGPLSAHLPVLERSKELAPHWLRTLRLCFQPRSRLHTCWGRLLLSEPFLLQTCWGPPRSTRMRRRPPPFQESCPTCGLKTS